MATCFITSVLVLLLTFLMSVTGESEALCIVSIKVPRNTSVKAFVMTELKINCTVNIVKCPQRYPKISWCKIYENDCKTLNQSNYIETEWKDIRPHGGISFLTFLNISMEDAGLYRCEQGHTTISHAINVTVTAYKKDDLTAHNQNNTKHIDSTVQHMDNSFGFWHCVNICRWSVGLIVILIGGCLIIKRA